jgi:hypothetical protein
MTLISIAEKLIQSEQLSLCLRNPSAKLPIEIMMITKTGDFLKKVI